MSIERARTLRKQMTDAERRLWYRLRAHRFNGVKFKRQVPIGSYVVDFASMHARVIVEVDGGQHAENESDLNRDRYLRGCGFRVLRFWNNDVLRSTDEVLAIIASELEQTNSPSPGSALRASPPSPRKRGEGTKLRCSAGRTSTFDVPTLSSRFNGVEIRRKYHCAHESTE
jgi:very-short-patch-repair endonuclease